MCAETLQSKTTQSQYSKTHLCFTHCAINTHQALFLTTGGGTTNILETTISDSEIEVRQKNYSCLFPDKNPSHFSYGNRSICDIVRSRYTGRDN